MPSEIAWGKLVKQGRAKAYGKPWSEEELKAIHERGISPEMVREGILEREKLEKIKKEKAKAEKKKREEEENKLPHISRMKNVDLKKELLSYGVELDPEVKRPDLMTMLKNERDRIEREKKEKELEELKKEVEEEAKEEEEEEEEDEE